MYFARHTNNYALLINKDLVINQILFRLMVLVMLFGSPVTHAVDVITNISADTASITTTQLRRIYSMRQVKWANGVPITIFVLSSTNTTHQKFCKETLRLFPYQLDRIWNKLTFSGMGCPSTRGWEVASSWTALKRAALWKPRSTSAMRLHLAKRK